MGSNLTLSDGDKQFIKLVGDGEKPSPAFRQAYPEHDAVRFWMMTDPGTPQRRKAAEVLKDAAQTKLNAKYIQSAMMTYQQKMDEFSALSLETATDLVKNARSEKVRADLAIEGIRHKVGTPVTKVAVQEEKTVYLTFGKPPRDESSVVEGEIVDTVVSDELQDETSS